LSQSRQTCPIRTTTPSFVVWLFIRFARETSAFRPGRQSAERAAFLALVACLQSRPCLPPVKKYRAFHTDGSCDSARKGLVTDTLRCRTPRQCCAAALVRNGNPHSPMNLAERRFVLTLSLVCSICLQSLERRKHSKVRLVLLHNVAPAIRGHEARIKASEALSLVNLSFCKIRPLGRGS
jgi:hypothetical protein